MASLTAVEPTPIKTSDRIIIALDVDTPDEARRLAGELAEYTGAFKVGMQLFTAAGPEFVRELTRQGIRVFLDLKFHDIPNTVAMAGVRAAELGVWMFNVHASGGGEMMRRTVDEVQASCDKAGLTRPLIIGVTVLTSSDQSTMTEIGVECEVENQVARLARLAANNGLDGVVCSPLEVAVIKEIRVKPNFLAVTPGIRFNNATGDDQRRVSTLSRALENGSDYIVIGRPVTKATDPAKALKQIIGVSDTAE